jgi:hypothetical protein
MVHEEEPVVVDRLSVEFDDERAVSDAGVVLVVTLAQRLGLEALAGCLVRLRRDRPGAANAGRKVMALVFARSPLGTCASWTSCSGSRSCGRGVLAPVRARAGWSSTWTASSGRSAGV